MKTYFPVFIPQCRKTAPKPSDKVDNDCDGKIDEEIFDGKDNDGDGFIDEDYVKVRVKLLFVHDGILTIAEYNSSGMGVGVIVLVVIVYFFTMG